MQSHPLHEWSPIVCKGIVIKMKEKTPKCPEGNKYLFVGVYFVEGGILVFV